ncbi:MAG TPA: transcriptional regulator [Micrococcales bacterium]|uniref:DNA-binding protein n=1 Tax=Miniimonas arenae TaxID=676201 RepID=A0A5C5BA53_9MICO|nr:MULTISPECIES: Rv2175c family DNA-binding protein [Miniimonas]TNU73798.1 DNA-binding protein [Miniimonas arenae]HCX85432.1 transcriptional regulator [Micrococcales bacterium]
MEREWEELVTAWVPVPDVARRIGVVDRQVRSMIKERRLLAFKVGPNAATCVPEDFLVPDPDEPGQEQILPSLRGSLTQLADSGYDELETLRWLYTPEESLGATPIAALRSGRVATVRRAAQGLAF